MGSQVATQVALSDQGARPGAVALSGREATDGDAVEEALRKHSAHVHVAHVGVVKQATEGGLEILVAGREGVLLIIHRAVGPVGAKHPEARYAAPLAGRWTSGRGSCRRARRPGQP